MTAGLGGVDSIKATRNVRVDDPVFGHRFIADDSSGRGLTPCRTFVFPKAHLVDLRPRLAPTTPPAQKIPMPRGVGTMAA